MINFLRPILAWYKRKQLKKSIAAQENEIVKGMWDSFSDGEKAYVETMTVATSTSKDDMIRLLYCERDPSKLTPYIHICQRHGVDPYHYYGIWKLYGFDRLIQDTK